VSSAILDIFNLISRDDKIVAKHMVDTLVVRLVSNLAWTFKNDLFL
jgi:hypothetical protein